MDGLEVEILAESVGNLQYDVTGSIVGDIAELLREKTKTNEGTGAKYISAADNLEIAKKHIYNAWDKCKKHMADGDECAKHPRIVPGYKETKDVSLKLNREDSTRLFISLLAEDLWRQAYSDETVRGRIKTAGSLYAASESLYAAAEELYRIL